MGVKLSHIVIIALLLLTVGFVISPYSLATVDSDSMEPEIKSVSDIIIIDTSNQNPEVGQVITYHSSNIDRPVTHRVVDTTENGYITKGDNNILTDQETGEPPVRNSNIQGTVVEFSSEVLIIPKLGHLSVLFTTYLELMLTLLLAAFLLDSISRQKEVSLSYSLKLLSITCIALILIWSSFFLFSMDTSQTDLVTVQDNHGMEDDNRYIETGEIQNRTVSLPTVSNIYPTHTELEIVSDGRDIRGDTEIIHVGQSNHGVTEFNYRLGPFEQEGIYTIQYIRHIYPQTLPSPVISYLHNLHPLIASLATVGIVGIIPILLIVIPIKAIRWRNRNQLEDKSEDEYIEE